MKHTSFLRASSGLQKHLFDAVTVLDRALIKQPEGIAPTRADIRLVSRALHAPGLSWPSPHPGASF